MKTRRANSRDRILAAAADVARETGPGSLSLDAVASRAGVSKGGLLYNFPTKAKLMQSLVEDYLKAFEQA
ncbi:TetR/AcrR family transcriptional regulator, partial [Mesorhizobium sp. M4A.F.Ca.ET.090.04.2.1]